MSFKIKKHPGNGLACEYDGFITPAIIEKAQAKVAETVNKLANPNFLILDHTKSDPKSLVPDDIRETAKRTKDLLASLHPRFIIALVAPEGLSFGLARMWYSYVGVEDRVNILRTREEAEIWIGKKLTELG